MTAKLKGFGEKLAMRYRLAESFGAPELSMSVKKLEFPRPTTPTWHPE